MEEGRNTTGSSSSIFFLISFLIVDAGNPTIWREPTCLVALVFIHTFFVFIDWLITYSGLVNSFVFIYTNRLLTVQSARELKTCSQMLGVNLYCSRSRYLMNRSVTHSIVGLLFQVKGTVFFSSGVILKYFSVLDYECLGFLKNNFFLMSCPGFFLSPILL